MTKSRCFISIRRFKPLFYALGLLFCVGALVFFLKQLGFGFSIQSSASMPKGIYFIGPAKNIHRGDVVIFKPPLTIDKFLIKQQWVPKSGILLKTVMAVPGDDVCKKNHWVWVDQKKIAYVFEHYRPNKRLPNIPFCGKLKSNQYLLMSVLNNKSFDGRYFGILNRAAIMGRAYQITGFLA
ncbi:MAG: hypothetical protein A2103_05810 [Gammaproteobacteria bacterium GWF2_41_13]|nr:MAG: hypothetical protein A2103_05810 [Gammaproteobacteria bacterium GWF2_41_13]